jgi:DNA polymerase-3 subunit epsilon
MQNENGGSEPGAALEQIHGHRPWREITLIAFDTETSGKYPLSAEICEIAAVKWRGGAVIETFETLIKPSKPMGSEVIAIHGITNEMVAEAPTISERIADFHRFIEGGVVVAHHSPFDLGFVAHEFEKAGLALPPEPALCSSLLSRKLFPESQNHRLQTLIKFFSLPQGTAHRALDDTKACLDVALRCLERAGETLAHAFGAQGGAIGWRRFSMKDIGERAAVRVLMSAIVDQRRVSMTYASGSSPGSPRIVHPEGLVRSLDGDFLVAYDEKDQRSKRYYLDKITEASLA